LSTTRNGSPPAALVAPGGVEPGAALCLRLVVAELRHGADRSERPRANHSRVDALVEEIECLDFDLEAASAYGRLRARLEGSGKPIGANDMLIAAHAVSRDLVLVTDSVDEFRRVKGLRLDSWRR
jgi:tRNA(fMet)-specific endonuclease VapC